MSWFGVGLVASVAIACAASETPLRAPRDAGDTERERYDTPISFGEIQPVEREPVGHGGSQTGDLDCGPNGMERIEAGCGGAPIKRCVPNVTTANFTEWCSCDGRTVGSQSGEPPQGLRYAFHGACEAEIVLVSSPQEIAENRWSGLDHVSVLVGHGIGDVGLFGPCKPDARDLTRLVCKKGDVTDVLSARRVGNDVVVFQSRTRKGAVELTDKEISRTPVDPLVRVLQGNARSEERQVTVPEDGGP